MAVRLLAWYDRHRRHLPWRAAPGDRADPYRVWLSEIMLQQTTVVTVKPYFDGFLARWPSVADLAAAPLDTVLSAWAGLGYYARARNLHKCAQEVVARHGGAFPADEAALLALPGIGPYTAAAIAAIAFDQVASPVDGNIERVMARIHRVETALPAAKPEIRTLAQTHTPPRRTGDYAQALMDLGATICTPRKPVCALCPWQADCAAYAHGAPMTWPRRTPKAAKPHRTGLAFLYYRGDGQVLFRRRPEQGLLGGMTEVPCSPWLPQSEAAEVDFDNLLKNLDKQGAIEENMLYVNRELALTIDDMVAGLNANYNGGASFGVFQNDADMALNLGFSAFRRGSYDFYKSDWKYLNDAAARGGFGDVSGVLIPAGTSTVYDQSLGKNMTRPFLHVRYRSSETDDRRLKSWVTGSVGSASYTGEDIMEVHYLSERCLVVQGANNFVMLKES